MSNRNESRGALVAAWMVLAAVGCGVQAHKLGLEGATGAAGDPGSGAAGTGATAGSSGFAGISGVAGNVAPTGEAGISGGAGTTGFAGATGAAGDGFPTGEAGTGAAGSGAPAGAAGAGAPGTGAAGTNATGAAGTAAPSGVTVMLGTTAVPKEKAIAFIHFGHSNMAGRGRTPAASKPYHMTETDPRAWMYHSATLAPFTGGARGGFEPALEPKTAGDRASVRQAANLAGGPGTSLVKQAAAMSPANHFISVGYGVASVYCSEYLPGGLYYNNIATPAKELKGKVTFAAILIYLGITERHGTTADIQNYPNCINQLVTALRNDIGEPNLPVLINGYEVCSNRELAPTAAFAQAITPRIAAIPTTVSNSAVVPADNPTIPCESEPNEPDGDHHFTLDGHKEYMRRALQIMKDKGWWRW
jgi:hypothetical protein